MLKVDQGLEIDENEIHFEFIRTSGPGGQNVNKVATAVQLRFDVAGSPSLPAAVKSRLIRLAGSRMTNEGVLLLEGHEFRTQEQNREAVIDRFLHLVKEAARKPRIRKPTKPGKAARARRLEDKRRRGQIKRSRQMNDLDWS